MCLLCFYENRVDLQFLSMSICSLDPWFSVMVAQWIDLWFLQFSLRAQVKHSMVISEGSCVTILWDCGDLYFGSCHCIMPFSKTEVFMHSVVIYETCALAIQWGWHQRIPWIHEKTFHITVFYSLSFQAAWDCTACFKVQNRAPQNNSRRWKLFLCCSLWVQI